MVFENNSFIQNDGIYYEGVLREVKKSKLSLRPVFEAFTNSLEAIQIRKNRGDDFIPEIDISIYSTQTTGDEFEFSKLIIKDNGIGFDDKEFTRFNRYKDFTKGFKNLGSGRIQYAHHFDKTNFISVYLDDNNELRQREFVVSKSLDFIKQNAIIKHINDFKVSDETPRGTTIIFTGLLDNSSRIYHNLKEDSLKESLLDRYMQYFCLNKSSLPKITIKHYSFEEIIGVTEIQELDIPTFDKKETFPIHYSKITNDAKSIEKLENSETFTIHSYIIDKSRLNENRINLTSKDEVVENVTIDLENLSKGDLINNNHFLFLVSSNYIDENDSDERGELKIPTIDEYTKNLFDYSESSILLDDIVLETNNVVSRLYPEILELKEKHEQDISQLKDMFLLGEIDDFDFKISVNDTEKKILEKYYSSEAKKIAKIDANIKERIDHLNGLDTSSDDYYEELNHEIEELVKVIPLQNRTALTHYVARRKLVLELFSKILDRELDIQKDDSKRNIDESLLHNLIFKQSARNSSVSDLWLVNEDFIYFDGTSETKLDQITIDGEKILRDSLTEDEKEYRVSLGEDRFLKRPDILLFPEEAKCIIIELKNPDKSVSDHLNQISNYATLLRNYTKPHFKFLTFYG